MDSRNPEKREVATAAFYKNPAGEISFFMQRRDEDAKGLPGHFGFFGGGIEAGESPSDAIRREIREELGIEIESFRLFSRYESLKLINHVFAREVDDVFEASVTVTEGQYGAFVSEGALASEKICDSDRLVLTQLAKSLRDESTW